MITKDKKTRLTVPATATLYYVISSAIGKAFIFLATPFFTRLLLPSEYGFYSLYTSWMGIFTVLSTFEISGSVSYKAYSKFSSERDSLLKSAFLLQAIMSAIFATVYMIFASSINAITGLSTMITLLLIFQIFLNSEQSLFLSKKRYEYNCKTVALVGIAGAFFSSFGAILLILIFNIGAYSKIIAPILVSALTTLYAMRMMRNEAEISKEKMTFLFKNALPQLPYYLSLSFLAHQDKLLIQGMLGKEALGIYSVGYSTALATSLLSVGIGSALLPWIVRKTRSYEIEKVRQILLLVTKLTLIAILAFLSLVPFAYKIIAGKEYIDGIAVVYPLAAVPLLTLLSSAMSSALLERSKGYISSLCAVLSSVIGFFAQRLLIVRYGSVGAAFGVVFSYLVLFLLFAYFCKKIYGTPLVSLDKYLVLFLSFSIFALLIFMLKVSHVSLFLILFALFLSGLPLAMECRKALFEK